MRERTSFFVTGNLQPLGALLMSNLVMIEAPVPVARNGAYHDDLPCQCSIGQAPPEHRFCLAVVDDLDAGKPGSSLSDSDTITRLKGAPRPVMPCSSKTSIGRPICNADAARYGRPFDGVDPPFWEMIHGSVP